jgi:hypothetical protein
MNSDNCTLGGRTIGSVALSLCTTTHPLVSDSLTYSLPLFLIISDYLDYGPFGFMERYDPAWNPFTSDPEGKFAYARQPQAARVNLLTLGQVVHAMVDDDALKAEVATVVEKDFEGLFNDAHDGHCRRKLGLTQWSEAAAELRSAIEIEMNRRRVSIGPNQPDCWLSFLCENPYPQPKPDPLSGQAAPSDVCSAAHRASILLSSGGGWPTSPPRASPPCPAAWRRPYTRAVESLRNDESPFSFIWSIPIGTGNDTVG